MEVLDDLLHHLGVTALAAVVERTLLVGHVGDHRVRPVVHKHLGDLRVLVLQRVKVGQAAPF